MSTFLIFIEDEFTYPVIVKAKNEKEALTLSTDHFLKKDKSFREYIYEKAINAGFCEQFWIGKEEEEYFEKNGSSPITDEEFKDRVLKYFKKHIEFYEIYIDFYFKSEKKSEKIKFPKKMIKFMWLKENKDDMHGHCWCKFKVVNLEKIPRL